MELFCEATPKAAEVGLYVVCSTAIHPEAVKAVNAGASVTLYSRTGVSALGPLSHLWHPSLLLVSAD